MKKFLTLLVMIIILIFAYARFLEPTFLTVKEYSIVDSALPTAFHGTKLVQISDLHYGTTTNQKTLENILSKVKELNPEIIVITGDLLDSASPLTDSDREDLTNFLKELNPLLGTYLILGEQDTSLEELLPTNIHLLKNESKLLYKDDNTPINLVGYDTTLTTLEDTNYYTITLLHNKEYINSITKSNLVLCGHSLGGTPWNPVSDYEEINDTPVYTSNGIGTSNIKLRLNNIPSISLFRLYQY